VATTDLPAAVAVAAERPPARVQRATPANFVAAVAGLALVAWLVAVATGDDRAGQLRLTDICVFVVLASMWNLLAGYGGLVSIGQQAYVGLGAYGLIVVSNGWDQDIYFSVLPAALMTGLLALPIAFVAFRLRGGYFAVGTWVIAEVVRLVIKNNTSDTIGGGRGTSLGVRDYEPASRISTTSLLAVLLAVGAVVAVYLVLRSRAGLALQAVRDDEAGARGLGANVTRLRLGVYLLAATFTGAAAAVYYLKTINVQPDAAFSVSAWTAPVIVMVVVGGLGTIEGPIIGAVAYEVLRRALTDGRGWLDLSPESYLIVTGLLAVVFALYVKGGIWGTLGRRFPRLQLFPIRRRLVTPAIAETRDHDA